MADLTAEWEAATPVDLKAEWDKASPTIANRDSMPANAGMVNFAAGVAGLPVDTVQNALNLGLAGIGSVANLAGKPDLAPNLIQGSLGGSESIKGGLRKLANLTGLQGINPDSPTATPTLAYDLASKGAMIPGGALPAIASQIAEKTLGPQWAGVGSLAPSAAITAFNAARAPTLALRQAQNTVRDTTLNDAQNAGYVMPLSAVNPTGIGNAVESLGGKSALKQQAEIKNQQVTNRLAREDIGLQPNAPITENALQQVRNQAAQPYRDVANISPQADALLQRLRDARSESNVYHRHYDMTGTPDSLRQARLLDTETANLETQLENIAQQSGRPGLVQDLRNARMQIAKTWDVERALNLGNGNVDAKIIGRALDRGRPLTGNLATIARFAEGPGRQFTREASSVPTPGVSALNWPVGAALGLEGVHSLGSAGAALASIPFIRGGIRTGLLSDFVQQNFNRPNYAPSMLPQDQLQAITQAGLLSQPKSSLLNPYIEQR